MEISPVIPAMHYRDAKAAIGFLVGALGFNQHAVYEGEGGLIDHAQLTYGSGMVMLASAREGDIFSEQGPVSIYVIVEDVDAHHDTARAAGAEIVLPPTDQDYGGRGYTVRDPEGNLWSFGTYRPH